MPVEGSAPRRAGRVPTIFAMGGGGFTMEPENPALDDYVRTLAPAREDIRIRIDRCRPHLPPPVVILPPRPRLAALRTASAAAGHLHPRPGASST